MKLIKLTLIILLASCSKIDNKREVIVHKEGQFYNENTRKNEWVDKDETHSVKVGERYKEYIASWPQYTLSGQEVWVWVTVDGKEVYKKTAKVHNIDIEIE